VTILSCTSSSIVILLVVQAHSCMLDDVINPTPIKYIIVIIIKKRLV